MRLAALGTVLLLISARVGAEGDEVTVTLKEDQAVSQFLDSAAEMVGVPILYDANNQRIRGQTMGTNLQRTVPKDRTLDLVRSILTFYEIVLVPVGPQDHEVYLAIDSRSTNNLVKSKVEFVDATRLASYADRDGVYIATTIPVRHIENLTTLRTALSTMVTPAGIGRVHEVPGAPAILVMDFAPNVVAIARIVKEIDVAPEPTVSEILHLAHAAATPLAATLRELFCNEPPAAQPAPARQAPPAPAPAAPGPRIAAYEPLNAIVVLATEADLARIRDVVKRLDVAPER